MDEQTKVNLSNAIQIHKAMTEYRDMQYLNMVNQINSKVKSVLTDDMGSQFVHNCGRDLAGEVVRNFFDTSDYNITVDQLATRILKFSYEDEYDPLANSGNNETIRKNVYNYNELHSSELDRISDEMHRSQEKLFTEDRKSDNDTKKAQAAYRREHTNAEGKINDELTGKEGTTSTFIKNGQTYEKSDLQADHRQAREAATYNSRYLSEDGAEKMRDFWNSPDNFQMMHQSANASKGDIRVCSVNGKIKYVNARSAEYDPSTDITYKATPEQLADAVCSQWENVDSSRANESAAKIEKLKEAGYLNEDGKVPKSVRQALIKNIRHSQNKESITFLQNADYKEIAKDAKKNTKAAIGKIIAGQIIYYAAPPLVFEIRCLLKDKTSKLDDVLSKISDSAKRIGKYVLSKLKDIFQNILFNSLKKFIKSFMDILINAVKATVKKLLKIAKNLVLSTVDAIRIIADKNSTTAEKADSVFNLFGVTITSCVIEVLFELAAEALHIPNPWDEIIFGPLQILVTVVCTNLTMLILQKADLFDVRFGFKVNNIKSIFEQERAEYSQNMLIAEQDAKTQIEDIIEKAREESLQIYKDLQEIDPKTQSVRGQLESINKMFNMNINFDKEWLKFIGMDGVLAIEGVI